MHTNGRHSMHTDPTMSEHTDCALCAAGVADAHHEEAAPDTSEDPCTEHGFDECPDCGDCGTAINSDGYYSGTRCLTCWTDPSWAPTGLVPPASWGR